MHDKLITLYQKIILKHNKNPKNNKLPKNCPCLLRGYNKLCGDAVDICLKLEANIIENISISTKGCALCVASSSIMSEIIMGKSIDSIYSNYFLLKNSMDPSVNCKKLNNELVVFEGVKKYPSRNKCVLLPWDTLIKEIEERK